MVEAVATDGTIVPRLADPPRGRRTAFNFRAMKRFLTHTPVLVLAAAVLASTTGGAVAAGLVTSKQIKDNTITTQDIKNGTITRADLAPSAVIAGPRGATGAAGAAGVSGYEQIETDQTVPANQADAVVMPLTCPAGKKLLSASAFWTSYADAVQVEYTTDTTATAYAFGMPADDTLVLVAVCAKVA